MASSPLLEVRDVECSLGKKEHIFHNVDFVVNEGDVVILQGKSGCGKSTLLKCLAHLNVYTGEVKFRGKTPKEYGIPKFRTHVLYVPQRPSMLPGTPRDFMQRICNFNALKSRVQADSGSQISNEARAIDIAEQWGIEEELWDRPWSNLSGGESQRVALAAALGLNSADVLLLDEPTSALDSQTTAEVEGYLAGMLSKDECRTKAMVWITHSSEQGSRVGTRFLSISSETLHEDS
ncbi:P-loop containing nucleoside triphosphate hydrolase protein, partial [Schizopora paradoxa]